MKGFYFGFIDNFIVAISAILGIHIDKYFAGYGVNGALYGALFGALYLCIIILNGIWRDHITLYS